ncbi:MAG: rod shape-determining protein MreD [Pseudomonadota bacterium]
MVNAGAGYIWGMRALFALIALTVLFLHLLPLQTGPSGWVGPDLLLALACAWVARRPDLAPMLLVAATFLVADLLLQRPPGLWAALALLATQALRARADDFREMSLISEIAVSCAVIAGFYLAYMALWALLVPFEIAYGLLGLQMILTLVAYPFVLLGSSALFALHRAAPGQLDAQGRPL